MNMTIYLTFINILVKVIFEDFFSDMSDQSKCHVTIKFYMWHNQLSRMRQVIKCQWYYFTELNLKHKYSVWYCKIQKKKRSHKIIPESLINSMFMTIFWHFKAIYHPLTCFPIHFIIYRLLIYFKYVYLFVYDTILTSLE